MHQSLSLRLTITLSICLSIADLTIEMGRLMSQLIFSGIQICAAVTPTHNGLCGPGWVTTQRRLRLDKPRGLGHMAHFEPIRLLLFLK